MFRIRYGKRLEQMIGLLIGTTARKRQSPIDGRVGRVRQTAGVVFEYSAASSGRPAARDKGQLERLQFRRSASRRKAVVRRQSVPKAWADVVDLARPRVLTASIRRRSSAAFVPRGPRVSLVISEPITFAYPWDPKLAYSTRHSYLKTSITDIGQMRSKSISRKERL